MIPQKSKKKIRGEDRDHKSPLIFTRFTMINGFFLFFFVIASRIEFESWITREWYHTAQQWKFMFFWYLESKCDVGVLKIIKIFRVRVISENCSSLVWAWASNIYLTNQYLFYFLLSNSYKWCRWTILLSLWPSLLNLLLSCECWLSARWALIVVVSSPMAWEFNLYQRDKSQCLCNFHELKVCWTMMIFNWRKVWMFIIVFNREINMMFV